MSEIDYQSTIKKIFLNIGFVERYKTLSAKFNESNFDLLLKKIDSKSVLSVFEQLGYKAKYFSLEKDYVITGISSNNLVIQLNFNLKNGILNNYLWVLMGEDKKSLFPESNFSFIYRYLVNDPQGKITKPTFKNLEEFKTIIGEILSMYEDFKQGLDNQLKMQQ